MENSNVEQRTNEHEHERNETGDGLLSADTRRDGGWMGGVVIRIREIVSAKSDPPVLGMDQYQV